MASYKFKGDFRFLFFLLNQKINKKWVVFVFSQYMVPLSPPNLLRLYLG